MTRLPTLTSKFFNRGEVDIFSDFNKLFEGMSKDFDLMFNTGIYETEDNYVCEIEVPGFTKNDIKIEICDGIMTVSGKREMKHKNGVGTSEIHKKITVGELEPVDASVENGILSISFVKEKEKEVKKVELN